MRFFQCAIYRFFSFRFFSAMIINIAFISSVTFASSSSLTSSSLINSPLTSSYLNTQDTKAPSSLNAHIQKYHLKNGLTLIVKENHRMPVAVFEIWYRVGGVDEVPGETGISHAVEHMMFEGSKNFPGHAFVNNAVSIGANFNAETSADSTHYYIETTPQNLPHIFAIEADRMQNLKINPEAFAKQMEVVKEERRMRVENNPEEQTYERFAYAALPGNPYKSPTVGWMRDIDEFTPNKIQHWHDRWYAPNNAFIIITGDVNSNKIKQQIEYYFGAIPSKSLPRTSSFKDIPALSERQLTLHLATQLPYLEMGYNVPSLKTAEYPNEAFALAIIASVLNDGDSSRLNTDLVHGKKIASHLEVNYDLLTRYSKLFELNGTPSPNHNLIELQQALQEELNRFKTTPLSNEELHKIKIGLEANYIYTQDSLLSEADLLGKLSILNLPLKLADDYIKQIEAVTPQDIQAVAQKYFVPERLTIACLYPQTLSHTDTPLKNVSGKKVN